jgi:DNA-binding transcriptional LysR family regulator
MDRRQLIAFLALAEELHFGRAAERLGISQPPLSQRIRALEDAVGARLFDRTSRSVALTEAGRAFGAEARALLDQSERVVAAARRAARGETGELLLAMTTSTPLLDLTTRIVRDFHGARPDVHLSIVERHSAEQIEALATGRLHAGFMRLPGDRVPTSAAVDGIALGSEPLALFVRADDPLAIDWAGRAIPLAEVMARPFVAFRQHPPMAVAAQAVALCRAAGFEPRVVNETSESVILCGLVAAGVGVAILPRSFMAIGVGGLASLAIASPAPATIATWLAFPRALNAPVTRAFVDSARRTLAESDVGGGGHAADASLLGP